MESDLGQLDHGRGGVDPRALAAAVLLLVGWASMGPATPRVGAETAEETVQTSFVARLRASGYRPLFGTVDDGRSRMSLPRFRVYGPDGRLRADLDGVGGDWVDRVREATVGAVGTTPSSAPSLEDHLPHLEALDGTSWQPPDGVVLWLHYGADWCEPCLEPLELAGSLLAELRAEGVEESVRLVQIEADMMKLDDAEQLDLFGVVMDPPKESLVGAAAPELVVETWLNSEALSWDGLRGKVVLLDFWATWCKPCVSAFDDLTALQQSYGDRGLQVVTVHHPYRRSTAAVFLEERGIDLPTGLDAGESTLAYGADGVPIYVLVDRGGTVRSVAADKPTPELVEALLGESGVR